MMERGTTKASQVQKALCTLWWKVRRVKYNERHISVKSVRILKCKQGTCQGVVPVRHFERKTRDTRNTQMLLQEQQWTYIYVIIIPTVHVHTGKPFGVLLVG